MFKNILIGQYINTGSILHRLDARVKIIITAAAAVMIFTAGKPAAVMYVLVLCTGFTVLSGLRPSVLLRSIKPVIFLAAFTFVFNLLSGDGRELFRVWIFRGTYEGLYAGALSALRLIMLVAAASVLTLTTKPLDLTDAIESILKPLSVFKVPVRDIAVMMGISIRFIPIIGEEARRITEAQKSRCADFDGAGIIKKAKAALPLVIPLIVGAFRHSDALASAMDARCYGAGARSRMHERKILTRDICALALCFIFAAILAGVELL